MLPGLENASHGGFGESTEETLCGLESVSLGGFGERTGNVLPGLEIVSYKGVCDEYVLREAWCSKRQGSVGEAHSLVTVCC